MKETISLEYKIITLLIMLLIIPLLLHYNLIVSLVIFWIAAALIFFAIKVDERLWFNAALWFGVNTSITYILFKYDTFLVHFYWSSIKVNLINQDLY